MTPSQQIRWGGLMLMVSTSLGLLLQTSVQAFWFYRARPAGKGGGVVYDLMIIWPCFVLLLVPVIVGAGFVCCGWYRRNRRAKERVSSAND